MSTKVVSVSFPKEVLAEADTLIPPNKRSKAIVAAFSKYLRDLKRKKAEEEITAAYKKMSPEEKKEMNMIAKSSLLDDYEQYY